MTASPDAARRSWTLVLLFLVAGTLFVGSILFILSRAGAL